MRKISLKRMHERGIKPINKHMTEPYTQKRYTITHRNINEFVRPHWHRDFRQSHIDNIRRGINRGNHFSETITVNVSKNKYAVINGNHRIQAIRHIIGNDKDFTIQIRLTVYHGLDREEEIKLYNIINTAKAETLIDRIKAECIDTPIIKNIQSSFPVKLLFRTPAHNEVNALSVIQILSPYINRKKKRFVLASSMINEIKQLDNTSHESMKSFMNIFMKIFGEISKGNIITQKMNMAVLGKIYFNNVPYDISETQFIKKITKLKRTYYDYFIKFKSKENEGEIFYRFLLEKLQHGKKRLWSVYDDADDNGDKK